METVNIQQAKTHLFCLIDRLVTSGGLIIVKYGKLVTKVVPLSAPHGKAKRLGFMAGDLRVSADCYRLGSDDIEILFRDPLALPSSVTLPNG